MAESFVHRVLRADDLVVLTIRFTDLVRKVPPKGSGKRVRLVSTSDTPTISLLLAPQSVAEAAVGVSKDATPVKAPGAVSAVLSHRSRLVFQLPANAAFDFTIEDILEQCELGTQPAVPIDAFSDGGLPVDATGLTSIEVPWGVVLAPVVLPPPAEGEPAPPVDAGPKWDTLPGPKGAGDRRQLWHARLDDESRDRFRALWADPDEPLDHMLNPFQTSLRREHRQNLVANSTFNPTGANQLEVRRLLLSPLGAWLDAGGEWLEKERPSASDLSTWRHRLTMGRDQYAMVVDEGFLFPYGHRAALITITERRTRQSDDHPPAAYLLQEEFIVVRQPAMTYEGERGIPFREVRVITSSTPSIADKEFIDGNQAAFWPKVSTGLNSTALFEFRLRAFDHDGAVVDFPSPLAFIGQGVGHTLKDWMEGTGAAQFHSADQASKRVRDLGGRTVAFAPPLVPPPDEPMQPSNSRFETNTLEIGARFRPLVPLPSLPPRPPFAPRMRRAVVRDLPAVRRLTGQDTGSVTFRYHEPYLTGGTNNLDVFAVLEFGVDAALPSKAAGGLVNPHLAVTGLSRKYGPVGGSDADLESGTFQPSAFFASAIGDSAPKLLGAFGLDEVLTAFMPVANAVNVAVPTIVSTDLPTGGTETTLRWNTQLETAGALVRGDMGDPLLDPRLDLSVTRAAGGGQPENTAINGTLSNMALVLPPGHPLVKVEFTSINFRSGNGEKVDVSVALADEDAPTPGLSFEGELRFFNVLSTIFPPDGFVDPPALSVSADGIDVGFTLAVPDVPAGAFLMQNLALSAHFFLPYLGMAKLRLGVSTRENPFLVTYSAAGGGGSLALDLYVDGTIGVEASIEFGGAVALNLGVIAGTVMMMGGVYCSYQQELEDAQLTGYARMVGMVEVLGIVSASVEYIIGLGGEPVEKPVAVRGFATVRYKVKLLFVSKTVSVTIERTFSKGKDPPLEAVVDVKDWGLYCGAFAPEAPKVPA